MELEVLNLNISTNVALAYNNRLCTIYGIYLNNQIRNETKKSRG